MVVCSKIKSWLNVLIKEVFASIDTTSEAIIFWEPFENFIVCAVHDNGIDEAWDRLKKLFYTP